MVNMMQAYQIVNKSILKIADDLVILDNIYGEDHTTQVRMEDSYYSVADRQAVLNSKSIVAHNLDQYINKFYSIYLDTNAEVWIDWLIKESYEDIDLSEFGGVHEI